MIFVGLKCTETSLRGLVAFWSIVRLTPKILISVQIRPLREREFRQGQNLIRKSHPDFRINSDPEPDVFRITPKMYWIHTFSASEME